MRKLEKFKIHLDLSGQTYRSQNLPLRQAGWVEKISFPFDPEREAVEKKQFNCRSI